MTEVRQPKVIAIDGPAAAGKGTLARRLAAHLGYAYLDTGLLYRAVGMKALSRADGTEQSAAVSSVPAEATGEAGASDHGAAWMASAVWAAETLTKADLARADLRGDVAAGAASQVAAMPAVRAALLSFQRRFAERPPGDAPGAVLDGRDIGTVVCPQAPIKLFVTAALDVRAERRLKELRDRGLEVIDSRVLRDMQERDGRDSSRAVAPLEPASDAIVIDTSGLDPDAVFAAAMAAIATAVSSR
jgi:CMP/dCMP kinase